MIDRIFKNWKTTLFGLFLLSASISLVVIDKATLTEAGAFIGASFALFYIKDPKTKATK